ncbi:hypothetical protein [Prochlorococcus sp. MIT 1341]|uniref:hypothetical protein n=1 Tax=Prochlorococcus sp. MIT 1341 TaxID=3096221 RepID=UPI002A759D6D|nr:hypothetical protein [Prochlorococcus sp. MIT 1341]
MFRKEEKKALTRLAVLSFGWPIGLDRFYDGKNREGILSCLGWALVFVSIMLLSPCHALSHGSDTWSTFGKLNPLVVLPLGLGTYGAILILRKGFRLLRQFETAGD